MKRQLFIQGIRGIPAAHGGFETFAEYLALYLVRRGWDVTVYCQEEFGEHEYASESWWNGVRRIHIPVKGEGAKATILFDYFSVKHMLKQPGAVLTLGYNTALFNLLLKLKGKINLINMDGIEWKRDKWKWYERLWLYMNERAGCLIGTHLIADHPEIKKHLTTRVSKSNVTMIPYGARSVATADGLRLEKFGLTPGAYVILIARPEPENSILEIVRAFSCKPRKHKLVVLGNYRDDISYHHEVMKSASDDVVFPGAVYNHEDLDALRFHSSLYLHGHTVGGTNPSLIEALGAGQPVLAHDNKFNRWVAGEGAAYFRDESECNEQLERLLADKALLKKMSVSSRSRFRECFTWEHILQQYEELLSKWI
jgi:glycosyltransferase involved in cell wall biosynthesis